MRELRDNEIRTLIPGLVLTDETRMFDRRVLQILRAAIAADVFDPYLVMAWEAVGDDRIMSVALTVNMGDGVQLAAPISPIDTYTAPNGGPYGMGVPGARHVLDTAWKAITYVVGAYERGRGNG